MDVHCEKKVNVEEARCKFTVTLGDSNTRSIRRQEAMCVERKRLPEEQLLACYTKTFAQDTLFFCHPNV